MSKTPDLKVPPAAGSDRRTSIRHTIHALAYVDLGPANGGIIRDLSDGGFALTAASKLPEGDLPPMRVNLPGLQDPIEVKGRIAWLSESKKDAGVAFHRVPRSELERIKEWIGTDQGRGSSGNHQSAKAVATVPVSVEGASTDEVHPGSQESPAPPNPAPPDVHVGPTASVDAAAEPLTAIELPPLSALEPTARRNKRASVLIIALIALISFGAGIAIERRQFRAVAPQVSEGKSAEEASTGQDTASHPQTESPGQQEATSQPAVNRSADAAPVAIPSPKPARETHATGVGDAAPQASGGTTQSDAPSSVSTAHRTDQAAQTELEQVAKAELSKRKKSSSAKQQSKAQTQLGNTPLKVNAAVPANTGKTDTPVTAARASDQQRPVPAPSGQVTNAAVTERPPAETETKDGSAQNRTEPPFDEPKVPSTTAKAEVPIVTSEPAKPPPKSGSITISMPPFPSIRVPTGANNGQPRQGMSLQMGRLESRVEPVYPTDALRDGIEGTVKLHVKIGADGAVQSVTAAGSLVLGDAAMTAVRQWHYRPTLLGGQPIEVEEDILMVFRLSPTPSARN